MATITQTSLDELLKRMWAPWDIEELSNLNVPVLSFAARKGNAQLGGSGFFFPVRTRGAHGYAYISEQDDLPAGRQTRVKQAVVTPTVFAGVIQISGLAMAISSGSAMAFARAFDENIQSTLKGMQAYKEGALFRDGTGLLATFVDNPDGTSAGPYTVSDVGHFKEGMHVDIIAAAATTRHQSDNPVGLVDWVNKQLTFDNVVPSAVAAGDRIYLADSQAASGVIVDKEPIGLEGALLSTGQYLGIDRSIEGNWRSTSLTASKFFDEDIVLRTRTRIHQETGVSLQEMASSFAVICHPMQLDVLFKLAIPRVRYAAADSFELGHKGQFSFGGIDFYTSYNCPPGTAYVGAWEDFSSLYTPNGELHIDSEYNGASLKWVATKDQGLVFAKEYCAFACKNPASFARITSLTEQSR